MAVPVTIAYILNTFNARPRHASQGHTGASPGRSRGSSRHSLIPNFLNCSVLEGDVLLEGQLGQLFLEGDVLLEGQLHLLLEGNVLLG